MADEVVAGAHSPAGIVSETLNASQHSALKILRERNIGSINIDGTWIWPDDIRMDPAVAGKVIEHLKVLPPPADEELTRFRSDIHIATAPPESAPMAIVGLDEEYIPCVRDLDIFVNKTGKTIYYTAFSDEGKLQGWLSLTPANGFPFHCLALGEIQGKPFLDEKILRKPQNVVDFWERVLSHETRLKGVV